MSAAARCLHHPDRFAAARCRVCTKSFCRECVTENQGKLTCAPCLRGWNAGEVRQPSRLRHAGPPVMALAALAGSWLLFYTAGWWLENWTAPDPTPQELMQAAPK